MGEKFSDPALMKQKEGMPDTLKPRGRSVSTGALPSLHTHVARDVQYGDRYRGGADKGLFVGSLSYDDEAEDEDDWDNKMDSMLLYGFSAVGVEVIICAMMICLICG